MTAPASVVMVISPPTHPRRSACTAADMGLPSEAAWALAASHRVASTATVGVILPSARLFGTSGPLRCPLAHELGNLRGHASLALEGEPLRSGRDVAGRAEDDASGVPGVVREPVAEHVAVAELDALDLGGRDLDDDAALAVGTAVVALDPSLVDGAEREVNQVARHGALAHSGSFRSVVYHTLSVVWYTRQEVTL